MASEEQHKSLTPLIRFFSFREPHRCDYLGYILRCNKNKTKVNFGTLLTAAMRKCPVEISLSGFRSGLLSSPYHWNVPLPLTPPHWKSTQRCAALQTRSLLSCPSTPHLLTESHSAPPTFPQTSSGINTELDYTLLTFSGQREFAWRLSGTWTMSAFCGGSTD